MVSLGYVFVGLAAVALVIFRRRDAATPPEGGVSFTTPGHPYTTAVFFFAVTAVVVDTFVSYPANTLAAAVTAVAGVVAYFVWKRLVPAVP